MKDRVTIDRPSSELDRHIGESRDVLLRLHPVQRRVVVRVSLRSAHQAKCTLITAARASRPQFEEQSHAGITASVERTIVRTLLRS